MALSNTMIRRTRLSRLAKRLSDYAILYIQAPAGYGKTVFASQWQESQTEPTASVSLDEYDNTAEALCRKLKHLLDSLYSQDIHSPVTAVTTQPDFDKAPVEFLMKAAWAIPRDAAANIIIDDLHYLTDTRTLKVVQAFLMRLPDSFRVCILSRNTPPQIFSSFILKGKLKIISQEQMLFDYHEICSLYKSRDITITKKQAEEVLTFTEGWPIGINALLLSAHQIPSENMPKEWLEDFLRTQVWETWNERLRNFMLGICMEDELSESLCNVLTGESNSGLILEHLLAEGAFISRSSSGTYHFHRLFRDFLRKLFLSRPEEYRTEQIRTAGRWYQAHNDFFNAVKRFSCIKDYEQVACCFDALEDVERTEFNMAEVMHAVRSALNEDIARQYPYLFFMLGLTARNEGRVKEFTNYADQYYLNYPRIIARNPELSHNIFFLYAMDFRMSLKDIANLAGNAQISESFQGVRGSATSYFPLYHRSYRDFSELLPGDIDSSVDMLTILLGPLLGDECTMLTQCVRAGLYYEKGDLSHALELALSAAAEMQNNFAPESKFCTMILLLMINHGMHQYREEELLQEDIQKMIDADNAFYLQPNFDAVVTRNQLDSGDADTAHRWLETRGSEVYGQLQFFHLYGHFTTARAHIALGNFNQAVILLEKILELCRDMNRPIDMIEAEILLAIAFWKKKRGYQEKALLYMESAVKSAQQFGYEQVFINEGSELESMLTRLKNRTARSDYTGCLPEDFIKKLYAKAAWQTIHVKGLTGGRAEQTLHFTPQQKRVMTLMCEGCSYRKIAEILGIQFSTVRSHIELIYRKLDVSSMKEAILKIHELHILDCC